MTRDEMKPAVNDKSGHCVACGRDNRGYECQPCADDCPMYWEDVGIPHPEHPDATPKTALHHLLEEETINADGYHHPQATGNQIAAPL